MICVTSTTGIYITAPLTRSHQYEYKIEMKVEEKSIGRNINRGNTFYYTNRGCSNTFKNNKKFM